MLELIFSAERRAAMPSLGDTASDAMERARDRALIHRATNIAIESAFRFGKDLPVGAVAASGNLIIGRYYASDKRNNFAWMHAEQMAVTDALMSSRGYQTDTIAVTIEPCDNCQDFLATVPGLRRVVFGLSRQQVADLGRVKPHAENIQQRALRLGLPYQVVQVDDPALQEVNEVILLHAQRDTHTGEVAIDRAGLHEALVAINSGE